MPEPEPNTATLTVDGKSLDEWLRAMIREELDAAIATAIAKLGEIINVGQPHLDQTIRYTDVSEVVRTLAPEGTTSVTVTPVTDPDEIDKILGQTPIVQPDQMRGLTCAQAVAFMGQPCKGMCTHDTDSMAGPVLPSRIVDPDCFR